MIDPDYLLWRSHEELTERPPGAPNQTFLRRETSEFYYAVFHEPCRQIADQHVGATLRRDPRYALIYRSLDHGRAKDACKKIAADAASSAEAAQIAATFVTSQEARHQADYNPTPRFRVSEVRGYFLDAESAIDELRTGFGDKAFFLTRLLARERA
jgi:hypothetical protein